MFDIILDFLEKYSVRLKLFSTMFQTSSKEIKKKDSEDNGVDSNAKFRQIIIQDLGLWLTNQEQNLVYTFRKLTEDLQRGCSRAIK